MKKLLVFAILLLAVLAACNNEEDNDSSNDNNIETFEGTIQSIEGDRALLDAAINDNTQMDVYITLPSDDFAVSDVVIVEYNGMILESDPAQVQAISIEKK